MAATSNQKHVLDKEPSSTEEKIDFIIDKLLDTFMDQLVSGELPTILNIAFGHKIMTIPIPFEDRNEKYRKFKILNELMLTKKPDFAIFMTDAWYLKLNPGDDLNVLPSESPNRQEAIMIMARADNIEKSQCLPYERNENGTITMQTPEKGYPEMDDLTGLFSGVFNTKMGTQTLH